MEKVGKAYSLDVNGHCALLSNNKLILIDTGTQPDAKDLISEIKKCNYKPSDIENIIITHTHPDHVGGLATLKSLGNARIAAHEIEAKYISKEVVYDGPPGKDRQTHPGTKIDDLLKDKQVYEGLLVIHTPGHTPGHIALLDQENRILIAGDSLRNDTDGIKNMPESINFDNKQYFQSMKKLAEFDFDQLIMGHGNPVSKNALDRLKKFVDSSEFKSHL